MALDYSQIELRAVAELISDWFGTDSILRQSFAAGVDAHTATAMAMTGKHSPQDVTEDERQLAKPCNFGLLYRMGDNGFYNYLRANFVPDMTFEAGLRFEKKLLRRLPRLWHAGRMNMRATLASKALRKPSQAAVGTGNGRRRIQRTSTKTPPSTPT